jgi:hypothetical protein
MKRWWASWCCYDDDYRPLTYPPNKEILGWWVTDKTPSDLFGPDRVTICGLIQAPTEAHAREAIQTDWPDADTRFVVEKEPYEFEESDQFPLSDWMVSRLK